MELFHFRGRGGVLKVNESIEKGPLYKSIMDAAEQVGIISCEVRAYSAVAARAGGVQPTELLFFFNAYRYVRTGADSHAAMRVCVAGGSALGL